MSFFPFTAPGIFLFEKGLRSTIPPFNPPMTIVGLTYTGTNNPSVDVPALQAALSTNAGSSFTLQGTWALNASSAIPAGTSIYFNNATIVCGATVAGGLFTWNTKDVQLRGSMVYNAASFATPCFVGSSGGDRFDANIHASYINANGTASVSTYLFSITQCNGVKVGGFITSQDGTGPYFVYVDRGSDIDIANVYTPVGLNAGSGNGQFSPIMCIESTATSSLSNVNIHDCVINGGGTINSWPLIWVGGNINNQAVTTTNVTLSNLFLSNTTSTADALDVVLAQYVTIDNVITTTSYVGIDLSAVIAVTVSGCVCYLNRGYGFAAGDPFFPHNTAYVTLSNCQAHGNGAGANTAQMLIYAPTPASTSSIHLYDFNADALSASQYELIITGNGGTVSDVQIEGGNWSGGTTGHLDDTISTKNSAVFRIRNARGLNPVGNLGASTPNFPSSNSPITNNTGYDADVIIYTGTGVSISQVTLDGTVTAITLAQNLQTGFIPVKAGGTIAVTYTGGTPTWSWFGE